MSKLVAISKGKLRNNRQGDAEIYPEVHFPKEANLRWSGAVFTKVKTPDSLDMAHRISVVTYHGRGEALVTMLPFEEIGRAHV